MRRLITLLVLLVLGLVPTAGAGSVSAGDQSRQSYIVVFKAGTNPTAAAADHAQRLGLSVGHVYRNSLRGYSATVPAAALDHLRADPRVAYVERDSLVHATTTQQGA